MRWQVDWLKRAEGALRWDVVPTATVRRCAAPFTAVTRKAFVGPACLLAVGALGRLRQIALAPMVLVFDMAQLLARHVRGILLAIGDRKVLALGVSEVLAN